MDGQEGRERGSASKFQGSSGDGDGDGDGDGGGDGDRVTQMHLPSLALFHVTFLSHPKPRVYPTLKAQSGGRCPAPCAPQCPAMPLAIGWPHWCPRPHLHLDVEALGVPSWGHGLVAGCPRARVVWHRVPGTYVSSMWGLSHHRSAPTSQAAVWHRRRRGRFSSRRVQSVFVGKTATRREKSSRQALALAGGMAARQ